MKFYTLFDKPPKCGLSCSAPSLSVQSEKDSCDVNNIVKRFTKTGVLDNVRRDEPLFADLEDIVSRVDAAREMVERSDDAFWSLPSAVRDVIGEPENLPAWIVNNRDDAVKYGFLAPQTSGSGPAADVPAAEDKSSVTAG